MAQDKQLGNAIAILPFVKAKAQTGKATERAHAARLLMDLVATDARLFLEERLEIEKTATVRDAIEQVLIDLSNLSAPEPELELSPLPAVALKWIQIGRSGFSQRI